MKARTMAMAAVALGLASGPAWAQTTASGRPVAGAPTAGSGTPRAGTGIPNPQLGETGAANRAVEAAPPAVQAPAAGQVAPAGAIQVPARAVTPSGRVAAVAPGAMNDALFAAAAAGSGLCEVATGRLAAERGGSDQIKSLGQRMVADHNKANQELMALAAQKGMALPRTLPIAAQAEEAALGGLSGEKFDRCYIKQQLAAHITSIGLFEAEAERGQDPQLKAWAAQTLPALKQHLQHVKAMHDQMEGKAGSNVHPGE